MESIDRLRCVKSGMRELLRRTTHSKAEGNGPEEVFKRLSVDLAPRYS